MDGEKSAGASGVGPLVGFSKNCVGGPSTIGPPTFSSDVDVAAPFLGLDAGLRGGGCVGLCPCWTADSIDTGCVFGAPATPPSEGTPIRAAPLVERRVGLNVHLRFLPAHREHGNFLSHFVFVFAQLEHAIGVRPADFGIMPFAAGITSLLFWSFPWTV